MPVLKTAETRWRDVTLVCRKCQKKLDGGFGPNGDRTLKKALRRYLRRGLADDGDLAVIGVKCFDVCPKGAVVAVNAARPKALLLVPSGADLIEVCERLGLEQGPPRKRRPGLEA